MEESKKLLQESLQQLSTALKRKFGLPPNRPTVDELSNIVKEMLSESKGTLDEEKLGTIVRKHVKFKGTYRYEAIDNSDVDALIDQVRRLLKG